MPKEDSLAQFKNKVRVRVCGILENNKGILMIQHQGLDKKDIWLPPGGGINFGETIKDALIREFKEETGLTVTISSFIGINEYIKNKFHAIELFYQVEYLDGILKLGQDPELGQKKQILKDIKYMDKTVVQQYISISLKNKVH
jgi:8-oxo-dGTP diphosphatase